MELRNEVLIVKREALFLKVAIFIIVLPIFALCLVGLRYLSQNPANPEYAFVLYPIVTGVFATVIPFCFALLKTFNLLDYVARNIIFSERSVIALKNIKYCAIIISALYVLVMPFVYMLAEKDDAPGLIIIGLIPIFVSTVVAVFVAILQKLLNSTIDLMNYSN